MNKVNFKSFPMLKYFLQFIELKPLLAHFHLFSDMRHLLHSSWSKRMSIYKMSWIVSKLLDSCSGDGFFLLFIFFFLSYPFFSLFLFFLDFYVKFSHLLLISSTLPLWLLTDWYLLVTSIVSLLLHRILSLLRRHTKYRQIDSETMLRTPYTSLAKTYIILESEEILSKITLNWAIFLTYWIDFLRRDLWTYSLWSYISLRMKYRRTSNPLTEFKNPCIQRPSYWGEKEKSIW